MIEQKLTAILHTVCPNVYPLEAPEEYQLPALVYNRRDTEPVRDFDDESDQAFIDFQIDAYSTSYREAKALSRAAKNKLKVWQEEDVECVAYTGASDTMDNTTEVPLYRSMIFIKLFAVD